MAEPDYCDVFKKLDLRVLENCKKACEGCTEVYNLAADMGGMGFIQSCQSVLFYNNKREVFPNSIIANSFAFAPATPLEIESPEAKKAVKVSFS